MAAKTRAPLAERKRPARLALANMRSGLPWSDGKKIIEGEELVATRRRLARNLAGLAEARATPEELRKSNSMQLLRLLRRNPAAHGLPSAMGELLRKKAVEMHALAKRGVPASEHHLVSFRRLARKMGSIDRLELIGDRELQAISEAIRLCGHVRLRREITATGATGRHCSEIVLARGTRLALEEHSDGRDFVTADGKPVRIAERDLGQLKPCRRPEPACETEPGAAMSCGPT